VGRKRKGMLESFNQWSNLWLPAEKLSLSQWAEKYLTLSPEYSARAGPIKLFGFQKDIFDAFTDDTVEEIVLMCGTQLVKTILIQAAIAYVISNAPGPILLVQPTDTDSRTFSKQRLNPMIRDCEALRNSVEASGPGKENTIQEKMFPGGSLSLVGSIAPGNLARRSIRYLFCDELDKYPASAGMEGDPISLARERTVTFGTRKKIILTCSPTVEHTSRIGRAYEASDQRKAYVACPFCHEHQILNWSQVKWDNNKPAELRAGTAYYECAHCAQPWNDLDRWNACNNVVWRASKPFAGVAGFTVSHLYSPYKSISSMVSDFLKAKGNRQQLQVFVNTALCELWREESITPDDEHLFARREIYPHGEDAVVPQRASFLTCGVDIQDDRLEYEVVAWGRGKESWSIDYGVIQALAPNGQPLPVTSPEVWAELDKRVLQKDYQHESGSTLPILLMAIDTGYKPQLVYQFALKHPQPLYAANTLSRIAAVRSVVPIKGTDEDLKIIAGISKEDAARKRQNVRIVSVGTHAVKQELFDSLRSIKPEIDTAIPGACHFPQYDREYFAGLCGEQRIQRGDRVVWEKKNNIRNEPLDCRVYARAAASMVGLDKFTDSHWTKLEAGLQPADSQVVTKPATEPAAQPKPATSNPFQQTRRRTRLGSFRS
jgi:phage terminase large subunit GpA-like protein